MLTYFIWKLYVKCCNIFNFLSGVIHTIVPDNTTVIIYIKHQGGTRSQTMFRVEQTSSQCKQMHLFGLWRWSFTGQIWSVRGLTVSWKYFKKVVEVMCNKKQQCRSWSVCEQTYDSLPAHSSQTAGVQVALAQNSLNLLLFDFHIIPLRMTLQCIWQTI